MEATLIPWYKSFVEMLLRSIPFLWNLKIYECMHNSPTLVHIMNLFSQIHPLTPYFLKILFNSIAPYKCLGLLGTSLHSSYFPGGTTYPCPPPVDFLTLFIFGAD